MAYKNTYDTYDSYDYYDDDYDAPNRRNSPNRRRGGG